MNMKCEDCQVDKSEDEMRKTVGRDGKIYTRRVCKSCSNLRALRKRQVPNTRSWHTRRFCRVKGKAVRRGIAFDLTLDQYIHIMSANSCCYCGESDGITKSIDRVDNTTGYTASNCSMSCLKCNRMKGSILPSDKSRLEAILTKIL